MVCSTGWSNPVWNLLATIRKRHPGFSNSASYNTTGQPFGFTRFLVNFAQPQTRVGTYSYIVLPTTVNDRIGAFFTGNTARTVGPFNAAAGQFHQIHLLRSERDGEDGMEGALNSALLGVFHHGLRAKVVGEAYRNEVA